MGFIEVILTIMILCVVLFAITKKFNATTSLLCTGVVSLLIYAVVTGVSVMGEKTSGSILIDVFELANAKFASNLSGSGLLIMSVMGYVKYMDHIKASQLLALSASAPLKKLGRPNLVVALGIVIGAILKLCVPSHAGLTTLLLATVYPIFIASGVSVLTAASAVLLAGGFDLGPACPVTTWACTQEPVAALTTVADFFVHYQLFRTAIIIAVTITAFLWISNRADRKHPSSVSTEEIDPKSLGIPAYYAVFPLIPLFLVIIFSNLFPTGIKISVVAANFLGFCLVFLIHLIVGKGDRKKMFNASAEFWKGMGSAFPNVVALIGAASVFSAAIDYVGGTKVIMDLVGNSSMGGTIVVIFAAFVNFLMAFMTGSGVASSYAVLPMLFGAVEASGANLLVVVVALISAGGLGRTISPVSGAVIIAGGASDKDVMEIIGRTTIPALCGFITVIVLALVTL